MMKNPSPPQVTQTPRVNAAVLRELSVEAQCDPRTIKAALAGRPIHGFWLERRVRTLLESRGLLPVRRAQ
jgi:hypothetical protein